MSDTVDIYDDRGKLLESNVDIMNLAPTRNAAIQKIIMDTKRSVAVNLAGIQGALASGKMGGKGRQILGRGLNYDLVGNADALAEKVKGSCSGRRRRRHKRKSPQGRKEPAHPGPRVQDDCRC